MKKKQITSKLQFKKTTVVSFKTMGTIIGGTMVDVNTDPITREGTVCVTNGCGTADGQQTCITCTGGECDHPTTRTTLTLVDCAPDGTRRNCIDTRGC